MLRIAGVNLPEQKRIEAALTCIYGIGFSTSRKILKNLNIDKNKKTKDITAAEEAKLRESIEKVEIVEGELKHLVRMNIKRYKEIGCYRGIRHQKGLPVRGQRTRTNNRTVRGNVRKTAGSGRKTAAEKT